MRRELWLDRRGPLRRAAWLEDGVLTDLAVDREDRPAHAGDIRLGRVVRIVAGLEAAFVEIGLDQPALLNAADMRPARRGARIGQLLRTGQTLLLQVKADAHGDKGAVVTMDVTLPGRFLVFMPQADGLHLSKRLGKGPEVGRLRQTLAETVPNRGGWIVRADAAGIDPALVALEAEALLELWHGTETAAASATAPALLRPAPDAVARALAEWTGRGVEAIRAEGPALADTVRLWCRDRAPDLAARLQPHAGRPLLFETEDLDGVIAGLGGRRVPLGQGGSLVIDKTEALTVIDVNGGERGNPLAINLAAAGEIARQLRLRNLAGIIIVDFVNMGRAGDREAVIQALSHAVSNDPVATHVYGMSRLGLVEMTRARRGPALADLLTETL